MNHDVGNALAQRGFHPVQRIGPEQLSDGDGREHLEDGGPRELQRQAAARLSHVPGRCKGCA